MSCRSPELLAAQLVRQLQQKFLLYVNNVRLIDNMNTKQSIYTEIL